QCSRRDISIPEKSRQTVASNESTRSHQLVAPDNCGQIPSIARRRAQRRQTCLTNPSFRNSAGIADVGRSWFAPWCASAPAGTRSSTPSDADQRNQDCRPSDEWVLQGDRCGADTPADTSARRTVLVDGSGSLPTTQRLPSVLARGRVAAMCYS